MYELTDPHEVDGTTKLDTVIDRLSDKLKGRIQVIIREHLKAARVAVPAVSRRDRKVTAKVMQSKALHKEVRALLIAELGDGKHLDFKLELG
jgi:hypothetical protein